MINSKQITQELDWLSSFKEIVASYEEIAALRMQKVRDKLLKNRVYFTEVHEVFARVKSSSKGAFEKQKLISTSKKNGKTVAVLLSANTSFYGTIVRRVFEFFVHDVLAKRYDAVIVGRVGRTLYESGKYTFPVTYYDLPDTTIDYASFQKILSFVVPYESVLVYHGFFKNLITQDPTASDVTGDTLFAAEKEVEPVKQSRWIFEPSLGDVLTFFEREIFTSLFVHTLHEAQLARYSSRMVTLERALANINRSSQMAVREKIRIDHRTTNKKQLGGFSGLILWQLH